MDICMCMYPSPRISMIISICEYIESKSIYEVFFVLVILNIHGCKASSDLLMQIGIGDIGTIGI